MGLRKSDMIKRAHTHTKAVSLKNIPHLPALFLCFFPGVAIPCLLFRFLPFDEIFGISVFTELTPGTPSGIGPGFAGLAGLTVGGCSEVVRHGKAGTTVNTV